MRSGFSPEKRKIWGEGCRRTTSKAASNETAGEIFLSLRAAGWKNKVSREAEKSPPSEAFKRLAEMV